MITLRVALMIVGFICLLLTALNVSAPRMHLGWLGLALWLLAILLT